MSGPVTQEDTSAGAGTVAAAGDLEVLEGRATEVGGIPVTRLLPKRAHRTVGAWCFVDHFGPADAEMQIGPHPHMGLHTVTWVLSGEVVHRDSLGSEQPIRPGQLNLMTAGRGVAHAEETPARHADAMHGVQLWVAQPDDTRHGDAVFEHHGELPQVDVGAATATVLVGTLAGATSPARADTPLVGADLTLRGAGVVPLDSTFEHAVVPIDGTELTIDGRAVRNGTLAYLPTGRSDVTLEGAGRVLLVGGAPFGETIAMWWNFVARTADELDAAADDWGAGDERFGRVGSSLSRIPAPRR
jgi:redox-sensitive bicupin YhaK (pirin superfamily)